MNPPPQSSTWKFAVDFGRGEVVAGAYEAEGYELTDHDERTVLLHCENLMPGKTPQRIAWRRFPINQQTTNKESE